MSFGNFYYYCAAARRRQRKSYIVEAKHVATVKKLLPGRLVYSGAKAFASMSQQERSEVEKVLAVQLQEA